MHTKGPWENGNVGDAIISKHPDAIAGASYTKDVLDYYGGAVICESVNSEDKPIIKAAPEMYEALKEWLALDESIAECQQCQALKRCGTHPAQLKMILEMRDAALLKAEGREG